ncbi:hypothetical protein DRP53_07540 [candidate division WOR-3 bacterium]|uniref:RHS repeat-associated core domain-containing protein n=1 Tax=candidate division WOR-3 bacterium TaxID=2052148 RepID=A0A660SI11_UNCW3|nr:MAG: hypothetical protein DRP53_07540 [candidate division WOR-3 bacterium]
MECFPNTHQFTGKERDENGRYYFGARYYDPGLGRFLSIDPDHPAGSSPYAYCSNQPTRYTDPTGARAEYPLDKYDREIAVRRYLDTRIPPPGLPNIGVLHPGFWVGGGNPTLLDLLGGVVSFAGKVLKEVSFNIAPKAAWTGFIQWAPDPTWQFLKIIGFLSGFKSAGLPRFQGGVFIFEGKKGFAAWLHNHRFRAISLPGVVISYGKVDEEIYVHEMTHQLQMAIISGLSNAVSAYASDKAVGFFRWIVSWDPPYAGTSKSNFVRYWLYYSTPSECMAYYIGHHYGTFYKYLSWP